MHLVATDHTVEVLLAGAVTANQLHIYAAYADHTSSAFSPGATSTVTNDTTPVTAVGAPGASTQRQVSYLSIQNADTADATVTVRLNDGTNTRIIVKTTLKPGETLDYNYKAGWACLNGDGLVKTTNVTHVIKDGCVLPTGFLTGSITGTKSLGTNNSYAVHVGRAAAAYTQAQVQWRVTTAAVTVTWAELGIATGPIHMGGPAVSTAGPGLTTRGFTDVSGTITSTGIKTTTITTSGITAGDDLWLLYGNQASTSAILRSGSNADNLNSGRYVDGSSARPSTMGGGTEYGIEGTAYIWAAVAFS